MNTAYYVPVIMGAVLMAYNAYAYLRLSKKIALYGELKKQDRILKYYILNPVIFFFAYVAVLLFSQPNFIVAGLLLGGSVFVWLTEVYVRKVIANIEENEKLKAELIAANKANQAKTDFLSNMSHDIRTPLNAIIGFTNLAREEDVSEEKKTEYLDRILSSSDQLLLIIDDVLEMSRIESGKLQMKEEKTNLNRVLNEVSDLIAMQMKDKQISFERKIEVDDPVVLCDKAQLSRALMNLLSNACKFTPSGGRVEFSIRQIEHHDGIGVYEFSVSDNGIGMSEDFMKNIFKPFEREKTSTVSGIQGTGLGVSITRSITEMMNGIIDVESKKGEGSRFTLTIPFVVLNEDDTEYISRKQIRRDFSGIRTLLVEDNMINTEIAVSILKKHGFIVDTASDGKIAVEKIAEREKGSYDLILMDIQMPEMDGFEASEKIREMEQGKDVPIIAMTANAFAEDKEKALRCGMNGHIAKPIDVETMLETISGILDERGR